MVERALGSENPASTGNTWVEKPHFRPAGLAFRLEMSHRFGLGAPPNRCARMTTWVQVRHVT